MGPLFLQLILLGSLVYLYSLESTTVYTLVAESTTSYTLVAEFVLGGVWGRWLLIARRLIPLILIKFVNLLKILRSLLITR